MCRCSDRTELYCTELCALDWIRTSTPVKELPPQDSVSTNSTTRANTGYFRKEPLQITFRKLDQT